MRTINQFIKRSGFNRVSVASQESIPFNLDMEFECKTNFISSKPEIVVKLVLERIKSGDIKIDKIDYRKEHHHFYSKKITEHIERLFL